MQKVSFLLSLCAWLNHQYQKLFYGKIPGAKFNRMDSGGEWGVSWTMPCDIALIEEQTLLHVQNEL